MITLLILKVDVYNDEGYIKAKTYEMKFEYEKAKDEYLKLSKRYKGKNLAIIYKELADLYFFYYYPDSINLAYDYISKAHKLNKNNDEILYRLALYSEAKGNLQSASKYYENLVVKFQKSKFFNDALDGVERIFPKNYKEEIVAKYDNEFITSIELDKEIENQPPFTRAKYESYDGKKELLNTMIENRLIYKESLNKGLHRKPEFKEKLYENLKDDFARVYYTKYISDKIKVDSSEVKDYYEKNKQNYRIWGFVNLKIMKLEDSLNIPNDSVFNAQSRILTFYENSPDSNLYKQFSQKDTSKLFVDKIKDTLYAIKIIKIQKPDYIKFEDVYSSIESNLRFEKERNSWEKLLDSLLNKFGFEIINKDTTIEQIPETLAIIKLLDIYLMKKDYENYLNKVPPVYRKAYSTKDGAYELIRIFTQRELLFKDAIANKRIFIRSDGYKLFTKSFENLIIDNLRNEVIKDVSVSEDEIKNYYNENREKQFRIPANAKIRKLTLDDEKTAQKIFNILKNNPQKFDSIAKTIAKDEEEKEFGGFVFITENDTSLFNEIKNLKVGKPALIKKENKWIIISVQEFNPSKYRSLDEVKEQINNILLNNKRNEKWENFKKDLKSKVSVEILLKEEKQGG